MSATRSAPHSSEVPHPSSSSHVGSSHASASRSVAEPSPWVMTPSGLVIVDRQTGKAATTLQKLSTSGQATRLTRGVYILANQLPTKKWQHYQLRCEAFGIQTKRVLAGISAAAMWGMWLVDSAPSVVETFRVNQPGKQSKRKGEHCLGGKLPLHLVQTREWTQLFDLPSGKHEVLIRATVTSPERTLIDIFRYHGQVATFVALCSALRSKLVSKDSLIAAYSESTKLSLRRIKGFPEVVDLVIQNGGPTLDSALEAIFLAQIVFIGAFAVTPQVNLRLSGRNMRVDFMVERVSPAERIFPSGGSSSSGGSSDEPRLIIELDGLAKYGEDHLEQFYNLNKEKERADLIQNHHGLRVLRYGYWQVMNFTAIVDVMKHLGIQPSFHKPSEDFIAQFKPGYIRKQNNGR